VNKQRLVSELFFINY